MILVVCTSCSLALRILGDPLEVSSLVGNESSFWPNRFPCPQCSKNVTGLKETEVDPTVLKLLKVIDLTPQEAFVAFNGSGLPSERKCTKDHVEGLFKTPIRRVVGQETTTGRFILEHIEFWDGTRIHLGAAPGGAIIYKITEPPNYTQGALNG